MVGVYIVDDEIAVREGLRDYVNWEAYGIKIVGLAHDGMQALQEIEQLRPDLLITDVKMPRMSGIELANHLHVEQPDLEIIFLSGYDDTEFLKEAIKVEAVDYLFKPFTQAELDAVLKKAIDKIDKRVADQHMVSELQERLHQNLPQLRDRCMQMLIDQETHEPFLLQERFDSLDITLPIEKPYCVFIVDIDNRHYVYRTLPTQERQLIDLTMYEAAKRIVTQTSGYVLPAEQGELVVIFRVTVSDGEELNVAATELRQSIAKFIDYPFTVGIGNIVTNLAQIAVSYRAACEAVEHKLYLGKNHDIAFDSVLLSSRTENSLTSLLDTEKLRTSLAAGDEQEIFTTIRQIFKRLETDQCGQRLYRMVSNQLALDIVKRYCQVNRGGTIEPLLPILDKLSSMETSADIVQCLQDAAIIVCNATNLARVKEPTSMIERIKRIISERYSEELTIADLAAEIYLSPNYLCLLFKQEVGQTINDYLTEVRMSVAKKLLEDPANKIYHVCSQVGFTDTSYFTKLFKRHVGVTPSHYRTRIGLPE
jgi:two-component system response regulator YesN